MSVEEPTDRERELVGLLREARDQMVELKACMEDADKWVAIGDALEYAIIAVDMRIVELKRSVGRDLIGSRADSARSFSETVIEQMFEQALKANGYQVVPITDKAA